MKELLLERKNKEETCLLTLNYALGNLVQHIHNLTQGLSSLILTLAFLQYFSGFFSLAFLEGHCFLLFSEVTSLHLDPIIQDSYTLQKGSIFYQYLILKLLEVLHPFFLFLLFFKLLLFSLLPYLGLYQFLLLVLSLHFMALLFKHLSVILEDVGGNGGRHGDTEEKVKTFLFCLYIVELGTITGFFG